MDEPSAERIEGGLRATNHLFGSDEGRREVRIAAVDLPVSRIIVRPATIAWRSPGS